MMHLMIFPFLNPIFKIMQFIRSCPHRAFALALLWFIMLSPCKVSALPIVVDPATPLTGTYAVEWNDSSRESWSVTQITGVSVSGGSISGTTSGTDPQLTRTIPSASRPDLDLGFNDYLELRVRVPANFAHDIQIYYGTNSTTGYSADRTISIPNATIPKDGVFHTYRIDVGPEPWWRSSLQSLRIDPGNASGVAFSVDYLRVGDLPGDVYAPNTTDQPITTYELSSKHFRFIWNAARAGEGVNNAMARGALRNAEEAWQVYVKILGYREPAESTNLSLRNGNKYKVNFLCTFDGFWMGGSPTNFAYFNIQPEGLQTNPPTWIIPHELMHVFQMHNTSGHMPGEWWETHANYGRERWLYHYSNLYPNTTNLEAQAVRDSHLMMSSGRNYYLTWLPLLYMDENPDGLPDLYDGIVAKLWQETQEGEYPMMTLERLMPHTSLKDIVGYFARRGATFDYARQSTLMGYINQDSSNNYRHMFSDLIQRADDPTWWRVPPHKAPTQGAYAIHQLIPSGSGAGRVVTVNLRGLADSARGADWRASFIAVSDTGVERYTPLWSSGSSSITLASHENTLYLSVAGTPNVFHYGGHDEVVYRFRSHPSRSRFHYEVQVTGATPIERNHGASTGLIQHTNGGGYRASTATVAATAYIGPSARVLGTAVIQDNARIEDYALISGSATVRNDAVVSGHAWVRGTSIVQNFARVRDWALVENATISGNARVLEHATVQGNIQGSAVAKGSAIHQSGGTLSGHAIVDGDYMFNKSLTGGVTFGHLPFVGIPDNFTTNTPAGLYAAYDFSSAHDSRALDQYGVTDAFTIGSPTWTANDGVRRGILTTNGSNQYIALDRSVADSRDFSFTAWVKPTGGSVNQALLWLGASATRRLSLTTSDGAGQARFSIVNGGVEQTLATNALPTGVWSHVAITLDGSTGVLYVNGTAVSSGAITIRPDELLAANTTTGLPSHFLARSAGSLMPMYQGSLDDVQFYSSALNATAIATLATPPAPIGLLMLSDHYNSESYDAGSFNNTLANDQQGYYAPTTYSVISGGQGWQAQHGNGSAMLLVGDAGYNSRASLNRDFALVANEFDQPLAFQMDAWVDTGNDSCWASVVIGSAQNINADSSTAKFAIRPVKNGTIQIWINGVQHSIASRSSNNFRIVLSDADGTGSAFDGNGSKVALFQGANFMGNFILPKLSSGDGYITFGAQPNNGYTIMRIDNFNISRVMTSFTWQGDTNSDFNTGSNYVENTWTEWANYVFDANAVNGTMNVDEIKGWGNLHLHSGLSTDINIVGPSIIHMAPAMINQWSAPSLGGSITIAADSKNLSISNRMLIAGEFLWNVASGRTLTASGSLEDWSGVGAASLRKKGLGTAILSGGSSYSGPTIIEAGTLRLGNGTTPSNLSNTADLLVESGAMLDLNYNGTDQIHALWVDGFAMPPGIYSSSSGFITGVGTLTVSSGPASANYAAWSGRGIHNLSGGASADDDKDSIPNIIEYALGGNPRVSSNNILPKASIAAGHFLFTFRRIQSSTVDTTQVFQYGNDLSGWNDVPISAGSMVSIQENSPQSGIDTVTISVPLSTSNRLFGRLKISAEF
jgi:autotransporter-associated beta strand protein